MADVESPVISFTTDLGAVALFDPALLESRIREPGDWWQSRTLVEIPELASGQIVILPLGLEGESSVRLSSCTLAEVEEPYSRESFSGLGLEVTSGRVFLGAVERLPGDGRGVVAVLEGQGGFVHVPPGRYHVRVQALDWHFDDKWYKADGDVKEGHPPEFVFFLSPRGELEFTAPESLPILIELRNRPPVEVAAPSAERLAGEARRQTAARHTAARRSGKKEVELVVKRVQSAELLSLIALFEDDERLTQRRLGECPEEFIGAELEISPDNEKLKKHSFALDNIQQKVTRVREHLRVFEQKVNSSSKLSAMEKVDIEESVTAVYDALVELTVF
jgi:hypothetical protein